MDPNFIVNNKPLIDPPLGVHEELQNTLDQNQYELNEVLKLDVQYPLHIVDTGGLSSLHMDRNIVFQTLLGQINSWNKRVMDIKLGKIPQIQSDVVNDRLYKALREGLIQVTHIKNHVKQLDHLDKVKNWYNDSMSKSSQANLKNILEKQEEPEIPGMQKIQDAYQANLQDFWQKYRSVYPDMDPAEDRVKDFKRKSIASAKSTTAITRPGTSQGAITTDDGTSLRPSTSHQYRMIENVQTAKRPRTNQNQSRPRATQNRASSSTGFLNNNFPVFESPEEVISPRGKNISQNRVDSPLKFDKPTEELQESLLDDDKVQFQDLAPAIRCFGDDQQTQFAYTRDLEINPYHPEKHGSFLHHRPSLDDRLSEQANIRLNQIYREGRNREVRQQREDEELIEKIQEWADNRGRIDEMTQQKTEVLKQGSRFSGVGIKMSQIFVDQKFRKDEVQNPNQGPNVTQDDHFDEDEAYEKYLNSTRIKGLSMPKVTKKQGLLRPQTSVKITKDHSSTQPILAMKARPITNDVVGLEQRLRVEKFQKLKQERGNYMIGGLNQPDVEPMELERRKMLSSSAFKRSDTIHTVANRPFSGVFNKNLQQKILKEQVDEFQKIHHLLANKHFGMKPEEGQITKNKSLVSAQVLKKSLMIPTGMIDPTQVLLPQPGAGLTDPPVFPKPPKLTDIKIRKKKDR